MQLRQLALCLVLLKATVTAIKLQKQKVLNIAIKKCYVKVKYTLQIISPVLLHWSKSTDLTNILSKPYFLWLSRVPLIP